MQRDEIPDFVRLEASLEPGWELDRSPPPHFENNVSFSGHTHRPVPSLTHWQESLKDPCGQQRGLPCLAQSEQLWTWLGTVLGTYVTSASFPFILQCHTVSPWSFGPPRPWTLGPPPFRGAMRWDSLRAGPRPGRTQTHRGGISMWLPAWLRQWVSVIFSPWGPVDLGQQNSGLLS